MPLAFVVRPGSTLPSIIEDLLELNHQARNAAIEMLECLHNQGVECRYAIPLKGLGLWELKTASRGGAKGGTRVYFFTDGPFCVVVNAESKDSDKADPAKLVEALRFMEGYHE